MGLRCFSTEESKIIEFIFQTVSKTCLCSVTGIIKLLLSCSFPYYWRSQWQPTPVLLSGKSHGQRSLVGCRLWGRRETDRTSDLAATAAAELIKTAYKLIFLCYHHQL